MGRKKVCVKVQELSEVDISYISLVKNAANRSPFKIIKSMEAGVKHIDLTKLFTPFRKTETAEPAEKAPTVAVIHAVLAKQELAEEVATRIAELGMSVVLKSEDGGVTTYNLSDAEVPADELVVVKLDDNIAVALTGVSKMFAEWSDSNDFIANLRKEGFYPSLRVAMDTLHSTIRNAMESVEPGENPRSVVDDILGQFTAYVGNLVGAVPVTAFKFEGIAKSETAEVDSTEAVVVEKPTGEGSEPAADAAAVAQVEGEGTAEAPAEGAAGEAVVVEKAPVEDPMAVVLAKLAEMETGVGAAIEAAVAPLRESLAKSEEAAKTSLEGIQTTLAKHEDALRGVVAVTPANDDVVVVKKEQVKKSVFDSVLSFPGLER